MFFDFYIEESESDNKSHSRILLYNIDHIFLL